MLKQVVTGFFQYHTVQTNGPALGAFRYHVIDLRRRGEKHQITWRKIGKVADDWLAKPNILTPGQISASPSNTQGRSRMQASCTYGSVRGAAQ